ASGTVRRQALDAALAEMERGLPEPSFEWLGDYSLVLGLERVLAEPQPRLASGTTLRRHQVDALAGQLAALISDLERSAALDEEEDDSDDEGDDEPENGDDPVDELLSDADEEESEPPESGPPAPDPSLAHDPAMAVAPDDEALNGEEQAPDPGARRRYR